MAEQLEFCYEAPAPGSLDKKAARRERRTVQNREYQRKLRKTAEGKSKRKTWYKTKVGQAYLKRKALASERWRQSSHVQIRRRIAEMKARAKRCIAGKQTIIFSDEAARMRFRRATNKQIAMTHRLRNRVGLAVRLAGVRKSAPTCALLGCSIPAFIEHLEKHFLLGMTWENRHLWHIDHVLPCWAFDLRREDEQKRCFNFQNLRPLWRPDNAKKWVKMAVPRQIPLI